MIYITPKNENLYDVTVEDMDTTHHEVTLSDDYYQKLTGGKISKEELLEQSFQFLLNRESNTMILRKFDLPVISRYFPEYESEIRRDLR
ncbi:MAG: hypothetical protein JW731_14190 [Bacteroidales bacterium]|nr:hypothetical protein [Bacteroidales bacterium]